MPSREWVFVAGGVHYAYNRIDRGERLGCQVPQFGSTRHRLRTAGPTAAPRVFDYGSA